MKTLPERWTREDLNYLLMKLEAEPILVADSKLGIPTIHDIPDARHFGFGLFQAQTMDYTVTFDAGGAMSRTPSGQGWTFLRIRGAYPYDREAVKAKLLDWLTD